MIEINLLPGTRKSRGRRSGGGSGGPNLAAMAAGIASRVRDPWLVGAVGVGAVVLVVSGFLFLRQSARAEMLTERQQRAVQDSTRYAAVLNEKRKAEAQRDSALRQLNLIRAIDDSRFVWPHLLDEVSRAIPPYTWLTSVRQTSVPVSRAAAPAVAQPAGRAARSAPGRRGSTAAAAAPAAAPSVPTDAPRDTVKFQIVGNTVDIQALTRFMRLLEASPFIENVELSRSLLVIEGGKEVTQFMLDAQYAHPDSSMVRRTPFTLTAR